MKWYAYVMLNDFRRRFTVALIQILAVLLGLFSAAVLLAGLFITAVFVVSVASLVLVYLAIFHRRRRLHI